MSLLSPNLKGAVGEPLGASWTARYVAALLTGFIPLYLVTRSSILIGDGASWIEAAAFEGSEGFYGTPGHFLQVPLARVVWLALGTLGLPVPLDVVYLAFSFLGTLIAIVFVGLIAAELLRSKTAAWLGALLFGTSLVAWTQWNGELYGLALGFATAGLFFSLRGRIIAPAFLWAFAVLSHCEFALAAPAFVVAVWITHSTAMTGRKLRMASLLLVLAGTVSVFVLIVGSWAIGKWDDAPTLVEWLRYNLFTIHEQDLKGPQVIRAMKGLLTAHTVAGHYWRDILTGRGPWDNLWFVPASTIGFLILVATGALIAAAAWQRRLALIAVTWLIPFHVLFNWLFVPTVEKYHAGALVGLTLLITGGLMHLGARLQMSARYRLYVTYVIACAGLNLVGAVLPMQALGREIDSATAAIQQLNDEHGGKIAFLSCDDPAPLGQVRHLRIRSIWTETVPEIQGRIVSWTRARVSEGDQAYVLDRWCWPEEWITEWSQERFDLFFLEQYFDLTATRVTEVLVERSVATNPFSWRRGDVFRLDPPSGLR